MRGFHDEMGGPESIAGPEWGRGVGMTAAGLPASPGVEIAPGLTRVYPPPNMVERRTASPSEVKAKVDRFVAAGVPSADTLRHNFLLRRHLRDPTYGVVPGDGWREKAANGLGVPYVERQIPPSARRDLDRAFRVAERSLPSTFRGQRRT